MLKLLLKVHCSKDDPKYFSDISRKSNDNFLFNAFTIARISEIPDISLQMFRSNAPNLVGKQRSNYKTTGIL